ncbi:MAG: hypothetical protein ACPGF7_13960 [Pontibacterium sp.]
MQAVHHWDVLAKHQAEQIIASKKLPFGRVYIKDAPQGAPAFIAAYKNLLTSQLIAADVAVSSTPASAAEVTYEVQLVEHKDRDSIRRPEGFWTAVAAGVYVTALPFVNSWDGAGLGVLPIGAAIGADIMSGSFVDETNFEVIITTQIASESTVLYSSSNLYYVNGGDSNHYARSPEPQVKTNINVVDKW